MNKNISDQQLLATLKRLERLAELSDSRFRIPFTKIRFGFDAVIGLVPFIGDSISLVLSFYLLFDSSKLGLPLSLKIRMLWNIMADWAIGLIPVLGDVADVYFKANNRNMKILLKHINEDFQNRQIGSNPKNKSTLIKRVFISVAFILVILSAYYSILMYQRL